MKKIVRKSHEKEIAYEVSKKSYPAKTERGAILAPPPGPDRVKHKLLEIVRKLLTTRKVNIQNL